MTQRPVPKDLDPSDLNLERMFPTRQYVLLKEMLALSKVARVAIEDVIASQAGQLIQSQGQARSSPCPQLASMDPMVGFAHWLT